MKMKIDNPETSSQHENAGRRRLVRGAVSIAPVVLTLRSGALAAASCTGAKTVSVSLISPSGQIPDSVGAVNGDVCYKTTAVETCPTAPTTKLNNPTSSPTEVYTVSGGKCKIGNTALTNGDVAILSSGAANSFLV